MFPEFAFVNLFEVLILGIESSCDETAAAVVRDGNEIISSVISSQIETHKRYGGVVPEIASREHLEKVEPVVQQALSEASVKLSDIDAIAVTQGPGLIGSLLVGVCYAKALAYGLDIPLVGVNHIEGHVYSVVFDNGKKLEYPSLALIVSGGHTNLFWIPEEGDYRIVSRTRDDAAGEAFDKVAKMLGLGYPGGPLIEKIAKNGNPNAIKFPKAKISDGKPDFSFSGLKTAVSRYIRENSVEPVPEGEEPSQQICDIAASFQKSVVDALVSTVKKQALELNPIAIIVAGGVSCNLALQEASRELSDEINVPLLIPSKHLSTDNAAMIAAAGYRSIRQGELADLSMAPNVRMRLQIDDQLPAGRKRYRT